MLSAVLVINKGLSNYFHRTHYRVCTTKVWAIISTELITESVPTMMKKKKYIDSYVFFFTLVLGRWKEIGKLVDTGMSQWLALKNLYIFKYKLSMRNNR